MNKPNLLFLITSLSGGGAERVLVDILKGINKKLFNVHLAVEKLEGEYLPLIPDDIQTIVLSKENSLSPIKRIKLLNSVIEEYAIDVAIGFMQGPNKTIMRSKLLSKNNYKTILTEHNNPKLNYHKSSSYLIKALRVFEMKFLYKKSDKIITVSEGIKNFLVDQWSIKQEKITVIYNPVDIKKIRNKLKENVEFDWGALQNFKIIIAIGRLVEQKGYQDLLNVFKIVKTSVPSKLLILGKGPLENELRNLATELGLIDDLYMLGFVDNPWTFLKNSDLYLSTSKWEGFHLTIVESMACGTLPVATDCNYGPREIIENNVDGLLVPVNKVEVIASEVIKILNDDKRRKKMAKMAISKPEKFYLNKIVAKYEKTIRETLNRY